jgi:hypothetical protein
VAGLPARSVPARSILVGSQRRDIPKEFVSPGQAPSNKERARHGIPRTPKGRAEPVFGGKNFNAQGDGLGGIRILDGE